MYINLTSSFTATLLDQQRELLFLSQMNRFYSQFADLCSVQIEHYIVYNIVSDGLWKQKITLSE